jgi:hypothetical protein
MDRVFLDALGATALPDPTTAGDFCRRFDAPSMMALQEAVNRARLKVWYRQDGSFVADCARIVATPLSWASTPTTSRAWTLPITVFGGTRRW